MFNLGIIKTKIIKWSIITTITKLTNINHSTKSNLSSRIIISKYQFITRTLSQSLN